MPHWDDEYQIPYLSLGSVSPAGPLHGGGRSPGKRKKVNTGFQIPGNEFPPKPKRKAPVKRRTR